MVVLGGGAAVSALGRDHGTEAGSYLRLIDSCITQLKAQGPSRTCNASKEEEEVRRDHARSSVQMLQGYLAHKKPPPPRTPQ